MSLKRMGSGLDKSLADVRLRVWHEIWRIRWFLLPSVAGVLAVLGTIVALRGHLTPLTFQQIEAVEHVNSVTISEASTKVGWAEGFDDPRTNLEQWKVTGFNTTGSGRVQGGVFYLVGTFSQVNVNEAVTVTRALHVPLDEYPELYLRVKAPVGAMYHLRFEGADNSGESYQVWWEESPLDDRPGLGKWEDIKIDMRDFARQAVGTTSVSYLTSVSVHLDDGPATDAAGELELMIDQIVLQEASRSVSLPARGLLNKGVLLAFDGPNRTPVAAVRIDASSLPQEAFGLERVLITYDAVGDGLLAYRVHVVDKRGSQFRDAHGPRFLTGSDARFSDSYLVDFYQATPALDGELSSALFPDDGLYVVFSSDDPNAGFSKIAIKSIELVFATHPLTLALPSQAAIVWSVRVFLIVALLLPMMFIGVLWSRSPFWTHPTKLFVGLLGLGILIRLTIAPFTGHSFDMEIWTRHMRLFYESGMFVPEKFPNWPLLYYIQLVFYAPYALARWAFGSFDPYFYSHPTAMVESVFLKTPFILADAIGGLVLFRMLRDHIKVQARLAALLAGTYLLNPLAIVLSGGWGMYDTLSVSLLLTGLYFIFFKRRYLVGALFFAFSAYLKGLGFLGFLPLLTLLLRERKWGQLVVSTAIPILLAVLVWAAPAVKEGGPIAFASNLFNEFVRGRGGAGADLEVPTGLSLRAMAPNGVKNVLYPWGFLLLQLGNAGLYLGRALWRKRQSDLQADFIMAISFLTFAFLIAYLSFWRGSEMYYLWVLPFLLITAGAKGKTGLASMTLILATAVIVLGLSASATLSYIPVGAPYPVGYVNVADNAAVGTLVSFLVLLIVTRLLLPSASHLPERTELTHLLFVAVLYAEAVALLLSITRYSAHVSFFLIGALLSGFLAVYVLFTAGTTRRSL